MNLHELQTIKHYNLPVKMFVLNNQGYHSIKETQTNFFNANFIGINKDTGISFPDCSKLADLYGFKYYKIDSTERMEEIIKNVLSFEGSVMCEVVLCDYIFAPKLSSEKKPDGRIISKPLEDLSPFLDRNELKGNMIFPIDEE